MDIQTASALADQEKKRAVKELYLLKRQLQRRAAASQLENPGRLSHLEREKRTADAIAKLRETLDLSLEEQVATQMACITQSAQSRHPA